MGGQSIALAVTPDEILTNPVLEARARAISQDLRCIVCQNQSIDDSNAPLAHDLRTIVREQLISGGTDKQVREFVVGRYGNFVILKPPIQLNTAVLWLGPAFFVIAGIIGYGLYLRKRSAEQETLALTTNEQQRISQLFSRGTLK
jgi:cytochrome c-type biogenesis protein CcmH